LWKQALESAGKTTITVPIHAPAAGEIAEVGALPGANVEAGQLLVRIVNFRRVLLRLEFPHAANGDGPPDALDAEALGPANPPADYAAPRFRAVLRGPAPSVEVGLQKDAYLYEIVPHSQDNTTPHWRPGLYVKALAPGKNSLAAIEVPASALLIHEGRTWVYVQKDSDDPKYRRYQRRQVDVLGRHGDKAFLGSQGWLGDELVVSKRAIALLSEEVRPDADDE
jgi:hypothetical protein